MITKEVNEWIKKAQCGMYSADDVMEEFARIAKYLTKEEILMIKRKLQSLNLYSNFCKMSSEMSKFE